MADLTVIAVGSLKEKYFRDAADEYKKRLSVSWKVEVIEIKEVQLSLNIDTHDFETKVNHAVRFLKAGNKVKVGVGRPFRPRK